MVNAQPSFSHFAQNLKCAVLPWSNVLATADDRPSTVKYLKIIHSYIQIRADSIIS